MKLIQKLNEMSIIEVVAFGAVIFITIWLFENLPNLFRSLKYLF